LGPETPQDVVVVFSIKYDMLIAMSTEPAPNQNRRTALPKQVGRDELNFAEFPIAALTERIPAGDDDLVFCDRIFDQQASRWVERRVIVERHKRYGLPTAVDDEILFALVQLTKLRNNFTSREVGFTLCEIIKILGWRDGGPYYDRLRESLHRWKRIMIRWENAWWNNKDKTWMTEYFNVIDNLSLPEEGRHADARHSFHWNVVLFNSFQRGNFKLIDAETFFALRNSVAKRMYRFLDKRFYHQNQWEFDLKNFALEHIGINRTYEKNVGKIKERLDEGIVELEQIGFITPMERNRRYTKARAGQWSIHFEKQSSAGHAAPLPPAAERCETATQPPLVKELVARGVTQATAIELATGQRAEVTERQIEVFDWTLKKNHKLKNPAGFLVKAIQKDYAPPPGFESREQAAAREKKAAEIRQRAQEAAALKRAEEEREKALEARCQAYWDALDPGQQAALFEEALAADPKGRETLQQFKKQKSLNGFAESIERSIRNEFIMTRLEEQKPSEKTGA
jgi:hypothetical protein